MRAMLSPLYAYTYVEAVYSYPLIQALRVISSPVAICQRVGLFRLLLNT